MEELATLPAVLGAQAGRGRTFEIIDDADRSRTFNLDQTLEEAARFAASLVRKGVEPGARVVLAATTSPEFVTAMTGTWMAGAAVTPVAVRPPGSFRAAWQRHTRRLLRRIRPAAIVGPDLHGVAPEGPVCLYGDERESRPAALPPPAPDDTALIQFTSGTTSAPKGVVLSHRAVVACMSAREKTLHSEGPERERSFSWLPLYHDQGLITMLVSPLATGMPLCLMATSLFVKDPLRWLVEMSSRQATVTAAPNFAYGMTARRLEESPDLDLDLSAWSIAINGAEMIDPGALERFLSATARFGFRSDALLPAYGLAENVVSVTVRRPGSGPRWDLVDRDALAGGIAEPASDESAHSVRIASVGTPFVGMSVRIADAAGRSLPDRRVGEIQVRSECMMTGYWDDPEATNAAFEGGWLRTGDLGYLSGGELHMTGRIKDVIVVHGRNLSAESIEQVANDVRGVRVGNCVAHPIVTAHGEALGLTVETRLADPAELDRCRKDLVRAVWREFGVVAEKVEFVAPGSLPKTTSGKLQRGLVTARYGAVST